MPPPYDDATLRRSLGASLGSDAVRMDDDTLYRYSTDASPCVVKPRAVAFARSEDDVLAVLQVCRDLRIPVTPRASGTSLSGAAVGPGIVLDTTRFARVLEFSANRRRVRVEPGILLSELNAYLAAEWMRFAPDPGSRDLCRIGGMVGHNASGYRSVKYGPTRDHVEALRVALADGTLIDARDLVVDSAEWKRALRGFPALERIRELIADHADAIRAGRRGIRKHSCGYDLASIAASLRANVFPVASLFVGSEGTLGIVVQATLRVQPIPSRRMTILFYLERFRDLGAAADVVYAARPSAMEAIGGGSLNLLDRAALDIPSGAEAMLLVEFDEGDVDAMVKSVIERVASRVPLSRAPELADDPKRQAVLWKVRRSLLPTLIQRPGPRKAWGFVEDPIVPRDQVTEFMAFLVELARRHGTVAGIYGHIGDGNTHFRPLFDPTDPAEFVQMRALREEFDQAVLERFRGAPTGEHGVGRVRADVLPRVWGPEVYRVMREIKALLDPAGILNPGVMFSDDPWWATWGGLESRTPM